MPRGASLRRRVEGLLGHADAAVGRGGAEGGAELLVGVECGLGDAALVAGERLGEAAIARMRRPRWAPAGWSTGRVDRELAGRGRGRRGADHGAGRARAPCRRRGSSPPRRRGRRRTRRVVRAELDGVRRDPAPEAGGHALEQDLDVVDVCPPRARRGRAGRSGRPSQRAGGRALQASPPAGMRGGVRGREHRARSRRTWRRASGSWGAQRRAPPPGRREHTLRRAHRPAYARRISR